MVRKLTCEPSELFLAAIVQAYADLAAQQSEVTPSNLWDSVVIQCLRCSGGFRRMFAWDMTKAPHNRIGTITQVIERGYIPWLTLGRNERGRVVVLPRADAPAG